MLALNSAHRVNIQESLHMYNKYQMKILITGGTGFIGNHVVRQCVARGDQIRAMVLPGEDRSPLNDLDIEIVEGNLTDKRSLDRACDGVEGMYHLAAIYKWWLPDPDLMYEVNVTGTRELMRAAMRHRLKRIVYTSSVAAVGYLPSTAMADETTDFNQWGASDYIVSKYMAEQEVRSLIGQGLPAVIVNPAFPFGPGDRMPTPTGEIIINVLLDKIPIAAKGGLSAIDVRDVATGHLLAMDKGKIGESYILANPAGNLSFLEISKLIRKVGNKKKWLELEMSYGPLAGVGTIMEKIANVTGKEPLLTQKAIESLGNYYYYDSRKAVDELGLPQSPIEDSVRDAIAWFDKNGFL